MKKNILLIVILIIMSLSVGCNQNEIQELENDKRELVITTSFSVNSIPFFYMMENNMLGENYNFSVEIHKTRDEATAKILKNEANIAMLSVQEAANMYNKEIPVKLINGTYAASFFLMSNDDSIKEYEDLIDKKLWTAMKGGPVSFTLNQLLINNADIDSNMDIQYQFVSLNELTQMVITDLKDIEVFSTRDPFVSKILSVKDDIYIVKDFDEEWVKTFGHRIPLSSVVMGKALLDADENIANLFNEKYIEAIKWVDDNPKEAAILGNKYLKGLSVEILENSIKRMNLEIIDEANIKNELEFYFNQWLEFNPEMIGNKLPDEKFYY